MARTAGPVVAASLVLLAVPLLVIAVLGGETSAATTVGGPGQGLKPDTVPAAYVSLIP